MGRTLLVAYLPPFSLLLLSNCMNPDGCHPQLQRRVVMTLSQLEFSSLLARVTGRNKDAHNLDCHWQPSWEYVGASVKLNRTH